MKTIIKKPELTFPQTYYSHGKLLITGEYLVLDGALALAIPTKKGQSLSVKRIDSNKIIWTSFDYLGTKWLEHTLQIPISIKKNDSNIIQTLKKVFIKISELNPDFLNQDYGFEMESHLEFSRDWGLGSSSTFLHNLALWSNTNPYELLQNTMGGSGYDIACAASEKPILYQLLEKKPQIQEIEFCPNFHQQIFFVYLNQKQRSAKEVKRYKEITIIRKNEIITLISEISELMLKVREIEDFELLMREHELLMSKVIGKVPIQTIFKDYFGQTKSLGAWGGDFIMVTGNEDTPKYFQQRGFQTVIPFKDMIYNPF